LDETIRKRSLRAMTSQTPSNINQNPFLPTAIFLPQESEQRLIRLNAFLTQTCLAMNQREIANYPLSDEIQTGQRWFNSSTNPINNPYRSGFRQVYQFGNIAAGATLTVPHNIKGITLFTHIYGVAAIGATVGAQTLIPLPYVDVTNVTNQVSLLTNNTNWFITNGATANAINNGIVVLEYLRN
jgi:hypothetical protein